MKQSIKFVLTAAIVGIVVAAAGCDHLPFGAAASAVPAAEQSGTYEYRIGQGDKLNIYVWRNPDLSVVAVPVRPDGKVSSPLVQEIQAAGKTPQELAKEIEQALSAYVKDPVVTVTVMEFIGAVGENVRVSGEVKTPQALPYRRNMTLLDVMIAAADLPNSLRAIVRLWYAMRVANSKLTAFVWRICSRMVISLRTWNCSPAT